MFSAVATFFKSKSPPIVQLDFTKEYSTQNDSQAEIIENQISLFQKAENEYLNHDKKVFGTGGGVYLFLWYAGYTGIIINSLFAFAALIAHNEPRRHDLQRQFEQSLFQLMKILDWCFKAEGKKLIKNPTFLHLLATVTPYLIAANQVIAKHLHNVDSANLPKEFTDIIIKPPLCLSNFNINNHGDLVPLNTPTHKSNSTRNKFDFSNPMQMYQYARNTITGWLSCFALTKAELVLARYGYQYADGVGSEETKKLRR